jgi:hypothetical protein
MSGIIPAPTFIPPQAPIPLAANGDILTQSSASALAFQAGSSGGGWSGPTNWTAELYFNGTQKASATETYYLSSDGYLAAIEFNNNLTATLGSSGFSPITVENMPAAIQPKNIQVFFGQIINDAVGQLGAYQINTDGTITLYTLITSASGANAFLNLSGSIWSSSETGGVSAANTFIYFLK